MSLLIAWCLLVYGVTLIVTGSKLFEPLRQLDWPPSVHHFLHCTMCVGFWVGCLACLMLPYLGPLRGLEEQVLWRAPAEGLMSAALCWVAHVTLARLGAGGL